MWILISNHMSVVFIKLNIRHLVFLAECREFSGFLMQQIKLGPVGAFYRRDQMDFRRDKGACRLPPLGHRAFQSIFATISR